MRHALAALAALGAAEPGLAQGMANMPGMTMPMTAPAAKKPPRKAPPPARHPIHPAPPTAKPAAPMQAMDHGAMPGMDHGGMTMPSTDGQENHQGMAGMAMPGLTPPIDRGPTPGNAAPPPPPASFYADRDYGTAAMAAARHRMMAEQGAQPFYQWLFNLAEYQARAGRDGYRWDGEAWFGGDINRVAVRTEGEGSRGQPLEAAEVQILYARAIGPYYTLQGGVRQDLGSGPKRTYLSLGVEGLAPYMIETEARLFVSSHGEVLGRLEAWYDQRVTQRLVLQPRAELNLAAQSRRATRVGAGLSDAELGLRLRYEVARKFAPYLGISYEAQTGRTADFARAAGRDPTTTSYVAGIRTWF